MCEIVPFPFRGRKKWLHDVATTFAIRRGANQKRKYIDKVIEYHVQRMQALGIAQERIDIEVAFLEMHFFSDTGRSGEVKASAA